MNCKKLLNIYVKWSNFVFKDGNLNLCLNEIFTQLMAEKYEKNIQVMQSNKILLHEFSSLLDFIPIKLLTASQH